MNDPAGSAEDQAVAPPADGMRFPLGAVRLALGALVLGAIASVLLSGLVYLFAPDAPALGVVLASIGLYGVIAGACRRASRRFGTGHVLADLGVRFEARDALRGPFTWVAMNVSAILVGTALSPYPDLRGTNTDVLREQPDAITLALVVFVAVVCAPFFEELLFRGLLLGALRSRLPGGVANGLQSVAFGLVHVRPSEGLGNVGLVLTLAAVGAVLGFAALRAGRLGPSIVGHAIFNLVATSVTLLVRDGS